MVVPQGERNIVVYGSGNFQNGRRGVGDLPGEPELFRLHRQQAKPVEIQGGQFAQAVGSVEIGPFGALQADLVAQGGDFILHGGHLFQLMLGRIILAVGPEGEAEDGEKAQDIKNRAHSAASFG